jgi:tetratricopeptide (TPR) repeat protein
MGEMYALKGDSNKAKEVRRDVIKLMEDAQKDEAADALVKHNVSREMAMAYMNAGNLDKALSYAQTDLQMRPDNIDANNLIAWIYYLKGDYQNAKTHADNMLHTHTKNATTLYEAGLIYTAAGDAATGTTYMQQAQALNPYIDPKVLNAGKPAVATNKS